jgi:predicted amidohydrolase
VTLVVSGIQHDIVWEQPDANFERLSPRIAHAAGAGSRLIVLTEMFSTGFSMASDRIAEAPDGPSTQFLRAHAQAHAVWVCGSVPVRADDDVHPSNRLVLAAPDGALHHYDKIHPFSYGREHEHYRAGDRFLTVTIDGLRVSFFVCYDLRFADEFWALASGTDCYVVVANWPESRRPHWQALLIARAIENQAYVVGVNRVGDGHGIAYAGDSAIIDPLGEPLATAARTESSVSAPVDAAVVEKVRSEFPFLQDRRVIRPPSC